MFSGYAGFIFVLAMLPAVSFAQAVSTPVTGTNPGITGALSDGTIPLPGTVAPPETPPVPPSPGVAGALYPPTYSTTVRNPVPAQRTLPPGSAPLPPPVTAIPQPPAGGIPTCLNVRYSYLCRQ